MSQTGVIIRRKGNQLVPNEVFEKALINNPTAWGAAITTEDGLQINCGGAEDINVDFFQETINAFPKDDITFYLGNSDAAVNLEDVSPYVLLTNGDDPLIVAFIEGNFPGLAQEKSSHPPEFFLANSVLAPKLSELFELTDSNLDKLMVYIEKATFKKDILLNAVSRGYITIVASNGKSVTLAVGDTAKEYPWGWVSNTYDEVKPEAKPEPAAKTAFPKRSTVREKASVPPSGPVNQPKVEEPKTDTTAKDKAFTVSKWKPAAGMSRNQRKQEYKAILGYLPKGWADGVEVEVYRDAKNSIVRSSQVKAMGLAVAGLPKLNNPGPQHNRDDKDTDTEHLPKPQPQAQPDKPVTADILPIMAPKVRDYMKDFISQKDIQKLIAENADIITDPSKVASMEKKIATFSQQLGLKDGSIHDFMQLPYEVFDKFAKEQPQGLAVLAWSFKNMLASRLAKEAKKEEPVIAAEATPEPAKKVAFPKRNQAA